MKPRFNFVATKMAQRTTCHAYSPVLDFFVANGFCYLPPTPLKRRAPRLLEEAGILGGLIGTNSMDCLDEYEVMLTRINNIG